MKNKEAFVGQIIDIFEDYLTYRDVGYSVYGNNQKPKKGVIPLHFEDEDSDGVFFGGAYYDKVADKLKELIDNWKL